MTSKAPALSTSQTEETFSFQKYDTNAHNRDYLGDLASSDLFTAIKNYYNVDKIADSLIGTDYKRVTLQFPDSLICDSSIVLQLLQSNPKLQNIRLYTLADTAYSPCCVDEVAAEHVEAELVIHMGDSCLNNVSKLPVIYSFGIPVIDKHAVIEKFVKSYPEKTEKICIMANAPYTTYLLDIYEELLSKGYTNLVSSSIDKSQLDENNIVIDDISIPSDYSKIINFGKRIIYTKTPISEEEFNTQDYKLFHFTKPSDSYLLYLTTKFNSVTIINPDSLEIFDGPLPSLMKRYKCMHVARTAGTIGILINTLSLERTNESVNKLISLIRSHEKKHYLFVVGKPNVPKLANFEAIDIWCVVGCNMGGMILDQTNEFYKPIITPYELTLALEDEVTWTGDWVVDFNKALQDIEIETTEDSQKQDKKEYSDEPEFDAVSGKFVSTSRPLRNLNYIDIQLENEATDSTSKQLVQNVSGGVIVKGTVSTSASILANRSWRGLGHGDDEGETDDEGAEIEEGISGVARGYDMDKDKL
ncbi:hypothetical protein TBLA_0I03170 [Henningerozyma blattae CBS 6284]|uniref:2-(3-amino-3-carboxypropyl)histidine synthase subunit 2 n=1 Tax=Henningerozyma blattae (strain ATCC 34711 / CBS 6284 / DSM 70876 / NBRC 10599 / NRRL Y-10934 / UCD 77-7) TaxID=1071380 RepID=I2H9C0_HENB6|nr:hypothetical protein TBLA_0I03170 [Tetrapisispora blattae CBS 6284]CCH62972.1 hypothetical protein TBLA_0I03170 [Tetrapisispora blattae CBS 6284]